MDRPRHVFLSCGEASGDRYGAALVTELRRLLPDLRITALGGPRLEAAGAELVRGSGDLAIMGFGEVVRHLPTILRAERHLARHLAAGNVDLFIPIDFPGFNSRLAGRARKAGVPVFWLVAPQMWAWGGWRVNGFRRSIDRLGTVLPFEEAFFRERGFDVFPMGHPLIDDYGDSRAFEANLAAREERLAQATSPLTVGLLPGSRRQELARLLPVLSVAARALGSLVPTREIRFVASAAPGVDPVRLGLGLEGLAETTVAPLAELLPELDLAVVCSGTASLEVALAGVPHDVVYRTSGLNYWLARQLVRSERIGLSNLILDRDLVPERVQEDAAPLLIARGLLRWLHRQPARQEYYDGVRGVRAQCGRPGVWKRTAAAVAAMLGTTAP